MTSELVTRDALAPLTRPQQEQAVSAYLATARDQLAVALEMTGPETVAAIKAEIATAAEATRQLNLSREIQIDAAEMVRRAEFTLGKAVRKGQEEGTLATPQTARSLSKSGSDFDSTITYFENTAARQHAYAMSDGVSEADFDKALDAARDEGNLSRANVVRKVKGVKEGVVETRDMRARKIEEMAEQGHTRQSIAAAVGIGEEAVGRICRDYGFTIPADRVMRGRRRLDSNNLLSRAVDGADALATGLSLINPADLDAEEGIEQIDHLIKTIAAVRKAAIKIKEAL